MCLVASSLHSWCTEQLCAARANNFEFVVSARLRPCLTLWISYLFLFRTMMTGKDKANMASPEKPHFGSKELKPKPAQHEKVSEIPKELEEKPAQPETKELEQKPAQPETKEGVKQEPPALKEVSSEEASSEGAVAEPEKEKPKEPEAPPKPKTVTTPKQKRKLLMQDTLETTIIRNISHFVHSLFLTTSRGRNQG